jgi:pyridoxal phosphate enzyme (YggS family)
VELLLQAGATELGENQLPLAAERFSSLRDREFQFTRHLIGAQQSRKLRHIPSQFELFQALDRLKAAKLLQQELAAENCSLDVLLQVNISHEVQKSGFLPGELQAAVELIRQDCPLLRIRGLMAIPAGPDFYASQQEFSRETSRAFGQMRVLFDRISKLFPAAMPFDILSQGMSQDYQLALAEGANMIRIGSALFSGLEGK